MGEYFSRSTCKIFFMQTVTVQTVTVQTVTVQTVTVQTVENVAPLMKHYGIGVFWDGKNP